MAENSGSLWINAVAGGAAGAGARLATAPLDLIRIRWQLNTEVIYPRPTIWSSMAEVVRQEGGFFALFRGSVAATYLWVGYSAVQFALYGRIKNFVTENFADLHPSYNAFLSGGLAGAGATLSTYPFDICRTTFAARGVPLHSLREPGLVFEPPKSLYDFTVRLYNQKGIRGFFAGSTPAVVQIVPYMGINFALYDYLTKDDSRILVSSFAGSISGATSKVIVYPADSVKKRLQAQAVFGVDSGYNYNGMLDCISKMFRNEGVAVFYRGVVPAVLKATVATGLSFGIYRGTKNTLEYLTSSS